MFCSASGHTRAAKGDHVRPSPVLWQNCHKVRGVPVVTCFGFPTRTLFLQHATCNTSSSQNKFSRSMKALSSKLVSALLLSSVAQIHAFLPRHRSLQSHFPCSSSYELNSEGEGIISLESNDLALKQKTFLDDGFVFGLEGSGLERPKGKVGEFFIFCYKIPFPQKGSIS